MKFVCFSYLGPQTWATMSESERNASMDEFFAYDEKLRATGHMLGGEGLQIAANPATLRFENGRVMVTDGPYTETKEVLAGFFILEARDLNEAIQLMSKHPVVRGGPLEIRAAADATEMDHERQRRHSTTSGG
jgi:hypothetical protein